MNYINVFNKSTNSNMKLLSFNDLYFFRNYVKTTNYTVRVSRQDIYDAYNAIIISDLYDYVKDNKINWKIRAGLISKIQQNANEMKEIYSEANMDTFDKMTKIWTHYKNMDTFDTLYNITKYIITNGFDSWKCSYINKERIDILIKIELIQRLFREAISNPNYVLCKKRLHKEFYTMTSE